MALPRISTLDLCLVACLCIAAAITMAKPERLPTNQEALASCLQRHPERYCRLTYAPTTIAR